MKSAARRLVRRAVVSVAGVSLLVLQPLVRAQTESSTNLLNWYYAHEFGTGAYRVGDTTAEIFHIPISYTLRPMSRARWGVKLVMPLTFGYYDLKYEIKDIVDKVFHEQFAAFTVTPGLELDIPFYYGSTLYPYLYAGYGRESNGGTDAFIYGSGVRLLNDYQWQSSKVVLGSALTFSGYQSSDNQNRATSSLRVGINLITPLEFQVFKKNSAFGVHVILFFYFDELDFESEERQPLTVTNEYEVAMTLGTQKPLSFLGIEFDRFGLAYRWSEELRAIRLITSFPF